MSTTLEQEAEFETWTAGDADHAQTVECQYSKCMMLQGHEAAIAAMQAKVLAVYEFAIGHGGTVDDWLQEFGEA